MPGPKSFRVMYHSKFISVIQAPVNLVKDVTRLESALVSARSALARVAAECELSEKFKPQLLRTIGKIDTALSRRTYVADDT